MARSPDLIAAHKYSIRHRACLQASSKCGCFYCLLIYPPCEIVDWTDWPDNTPMGRENALGDTALCPHCGVDSVLGDASGYPISRSFLEAMHAHWFCA